MDKPIVQNHYHGTLGQSAPSSQTQTEMSLYDYAIAHEHEHITQNGHWTHCDEVNQTMADLANDAQEELAILRETPSGNVAQNALSQIQNNFKEEMIDFSVMSAIGNIDSELDNATAYDIANEHYATSHWSWGACGYTTDEHTHESMADGIVSADNSKASLKPFLTQAEDNIEALTNTSTNSTLSDLISAFNGFVEGNSTEGGADHSYLNSKEESKSINTLLGMIKEQIEIDSGYEETKDGSVQKLSLHEEIILEADQTEALNSLIASLNTAISTANSTQLTDSGNVDLDKMKAGTIGGELGYGSANKNLLNAEYLEKAVGRLYHALETAKGDLSKVKADVTNYVFQSLMSSINQLMKDVKEILTSKNLTPKEKEEKLALILQQLLGFLQMFIQIAQNLRSENKQKMESATIEAQNTNVQTIKIDSNNLQQLQAEQAKLERTEKIMKIVEIVATVLFILTASVGGAIAMTTMLILDKTGVTQKWTQDLANDEGSKVGGDATMTGIMMVAAMAGGAGLDALIKRLGVAMESAIMTAEQNASQEIQTASDNIEASFGKPMTEEESALFKETVEKTAVCAAKNAAKEFYKDLSAISAIKMLYSKVKGIADQKLEEFVTQVRAAKNAAEEFYKNGSVTSAVNEFYKDSSAISAVKMPYSKVNGITDQKFAEFVTQSVETAIKHAMEELERDVTENGLSLTPALVESISKNAASRILSRLDPAVLSPNAGVLERLNVWRKDAYNKFIEMTPKAVRSGLWAGMYTAADTNLLMDAVFGNQNANSKENQKTSKMVERVMFEMIQMLMQTLAMMKGGGFMNQLETSNSYQVVQAIQRSSSVMQVGSQAVNSETNFIQYSIDKNEAEAVKNLQEAQSYNTLLRTVSNQDHNSADESASGLSIEEKRLAQEQAWLASHVWDSMNAGCKVLAAQSV